MRGIAGAKFQLPLKDSDLLIVERGKHSYKLPGSAIHAFTRKKIQSSLTPPLDPENDDLWFKTDERVFFLYSEAEGKWIEASEKPPTPYQLPIASDDTLGGVRVGPRLSIDPEGVLSADEAWVSADYPLEAATNAAGVRVLSAPMASDVTDGWMSSLDKDKLDMLTPLKPATRTELGGIIVGDNLTIDGSGVLSAQSGYTLPVASAQQLGGIKIGSGLKIDADGTATVSVPGALVFKGQIAPSDFAPTAPAVGDTYSFSAGGTLGSSWVGIAGETVAAHELVTWDGQRWDLTGDPGSLGVHSISASAPLSASGKHDVQLTIAPASSSSAGVTQYATASQTSNGAVFDRAVTPAGLRPVLRTKASQSALEAVSQTAEQGVKAASAAQYSADSAQSSADQAAYDALYGIYLAEDALPKAGGVMSGPITFAPGQQLPVNTLPELPGTAELYYGNLDWGDLELRGSDLFLVERGGQSYYMLASVLATASQVSSAQSTADQALGIAQAALPRTGGSLSGPLVLDTSQGAASGAQAAPWDQISGAIADVKPTPANLPPATTSARGAIIVGDNLSVQADGTLNAEAAGVQSVIGSKPITVDDTHPDHPVIDVLPVTSTTSGVMSASDKRKLNGIENGAQVNVQSDWAVSDQASDAFIKNKPEPYRLPVASSSDALNPKLGGVIIGSGLKIDSNGVASAFLQGALEFKGAVLPTDPAPSNPRQGDVYVISKAGTMDPSWTGIGGDAVVLHELIAYDGSEWDLMGAAANTGVVTVDAAAPLQSRGTHRVQLSIADATTDQFGVVELATEAQVRDGSMANRAVTPKALKPSLDEKASVTAVQTAQSAAEQAQTTADEAQTLAQTAESDAQRGLNAANAAQSTADSALSKAKAALPASGGTMRGALTLFTGDGPATGDEAAPWNQISAAIAAAKPKPGNLPIASATSLGAIKVGSNLSIDSGGVLSSEAGGLQAIRGSAPIEINSTDPESPVISVELASPTNPGVISAASQAKLDGIEAHAQVNVQADWSETAINSDAYIRNKPSTFPPPIASSTSIGGIKVGAGLVIEGDGTLRAQIDGALVFRGEARPTDPAPANPSGGDVYVMSAAGVMDSSWAGIAGETVALHELVAYDGFSYEWVLLGAATGTGIEGIQTEAPLHASGTSIVKLSVSEATTESAGVVQLTNDLMATTETQAPTANAMHQTYVLASSALPITGGAMEGLIDFAAEQGLPVETLPELPGSFTDAAVNL